MSEKQATKPTATQEPAIMPGAIKLGDKLIVVGEPDRADFIALRKELRRQLLARRVSPLREAAEELKNLPAELRSEVLKEALALQHAGGAEPSGEAIMEGLYTVEGCRFWVWHLARRHHDGMKLADLNDLITENNVNEVLAELLRTQSPERAKS